MNNILEFFIKMRDLTPPQIAKTVENVRRIEKTAAIASRSVQTATDRLRSMSNINPATGPVNGLQQIKREAEKVNAELTKTTGSSGLLGKLAKGFLVGTAMAGVLSFGKSSAQAYIDFEKNNKSYEVLAGNKGTGQALGSELNQLKQNSILGAAVYSNAKTLMSFGITADRVIPTLKMLGEVSMGDAERLGSLTLAFSQTQAAGKLMGQDLLQYVNAGFNPLHEMSVMTGKSMLILRDQMEKGAISSDMVTKAFEHATGQGGLFNGMLAQMSETTSGKIANMQGKFAALKIAMGERMAPVINSFIGGLTHIISKVKSWVEIPLEKKLTDQIIKIQSLQAQITASNTSHQRQIELLKQLEEINPNIVKGIDAQNISYSKLAENINNVTGALKSKIFMEKFDKDNAGVLADYSNANKKVNEGFGSAMAAVAMADPSLAQRTDMTIGQKQLAARKILEARIAKDPEGGVYHNIGTSGSVYGTSTSTSYSQDYLTLSALKKGIIDNNKGVAKIMELQPKINEINATKDALSKQIDQFTGVKSMTAAGIKAGSSAIDTGGTSAKGSSGHGSIANGITGGGPRVININGVKFMEKMADHIAINNQGDMEQVEQKFEQMFLRILNSGASVQ